VDLRSIPLLQSLTEVVGNHEEGHRSQGLSLTQKQVLARYIPCLVRLLPSSSCFCGVKVSAQASLLMPRREPFNKSGWIANSDEDQL